LRSQGKWISEAPLCFALCGFAVVFFYSTYKRLWDIQYYIPKQFSKMIKRGRYGAPERCCNLWWSDINVESVAQTPALTRHHLIHQNSITQDPSKQLPAAKAGCFSFSEDHKYSLKLPQYQLSFGRLLSKNNLDFYFLPALSRVGWGWWGRG